MPRPLRIEFENAWYHVMNRGASRQRIFTSTSHYQIFYTSLSEAISRFKIEIHAFCLMSNHYHLLVKTPYGNLSKAMKYVNGIYTQRFNRVTGMDGPLFRGRYKAILVDSDEYLMQISRYIHLNPVTANLCNNPIDYKWSSYRAYIHKKVSPSWLTTSFMLNLMSSKDKKAAYAVFVNQGNDEETISFYNKKHLPSIYGTKDFIEKQLGDLKKKYIIHVQTDINHTRPLPKKDVIISAIIDYFKISQVELYEAIQGKKNTPKIIAIYLLNELGNLTHKEISQIFYSLKEISVSTQLNRAKQLIKKDRTIANIFSILQRQSIKLKPN